jgi:hypothetical protein
MRPRIMVPQRNAGVAGHCEQDSSSQCRHRFLSSRRQHTKQSQRDKQTTGQHTGLPEQSQRCPLHVNDVNTQYGSSVRPRRIPEFDT